MNTPARTQLIEERKRRQWSQQEVANRLGTTQHNVSRWERGETVPGPYYRTKICELFARLPHELGLLGDPACEEAQPTGAVESTPSVLSLWDVPYPRNPFFTDREEILNALHATLCANKTAALSQSRVQAVSGLGGVGKTQTAVEYAHRYAGEYQAILWAKAETRETLESSFVDFARLLQLPVQYEQDPQHIIGAVKRWLSTQKDWLLLLDNVEDLDLVAEVLPTRSEGHVILTTRLHSTGKLAQRIDLSSMDPEEGAILLLRRAQLLAPDADLKLASEDQQALARAVSLQLGGLPLALDQAGAYIEETGCSLQAYYDLYTQHPSSLLAHRSTSDATYPYSVRTTFALSLARVEAAHPAAAELLRFCTLLHPDAIPEELFVRGAEYLGPVLGPVATHPLQMNKLFSVLGHVSLVYRHQETRVVSLHRLLQVVVRDRMDEAEQRLWAGRAVQVLNAALPEADLSDKLLSLQVYVPHARMCSTSIQDLDLVSVEAGRLLSVLGFFLREAGQFDEAEVFQKRSQRCLLRAAGQTHLTLAFSLDELAHVYSYQAKYEQAESLYQQALALLREHLKPTHPKIISVLGNLGILYYAQCQYEQAAACHQQALDLQLQAGRHEEVLTASLYGDQAMNYNAQGKYTQAEELYQQALWLYERHLAPEHPFVVSHLFNLACCYYAQGKYRLAEDLFQQTLHLRQQTLGPEHPFIADNLHSLGVLYEKLGKYEQAEAYSQQALILRESVYGPHHPWVAISAAGLSRIYLEQGQLDKAQAASERAFTIYQQAVGMKHVRTIQCLTYLGRIHALQARSEQAETLLRQALFLQQEVCGPDHPYAALILAFLAHTLSLQSRFVEAEALYQQALELQERTLGPGHPDFAEILHRLATFYQSQHQYEQARTCFQRALTIWETRDEQALKAARDCKQQYMALLAEMDREKTKDASTQGASVHNQDHQGQKHESEYHSQKATTNSHMLSESGLDGR